MPVMWDAMAFMRELDARKAGAKPS
jgi:hypothetical protein